MANGGIIGPTVTITPGSPGTATTITRKCASGSHVMQPGTTHATITMVAGGGSGGNGGAEAAGGGGAGGVLTQRVAVTGGATYPITIGGGGATNPTVAIPSPNGNVGTNSSMPTIPGTTAASGGGYGKGSGPPTGGPGGTGDGVGGPGGSGGGSSRRAYLGYMDTSISTVGQGFPGGTGGAGIGPANGNNAGSGGGGAGDRGYPGGNMTGVFCSSRTTSKSPIPAFGGVNPRSNGGGAGGDGRDLDINYPGLPAAQLTLGGGGGGGTVSLYSGPNAEGAGGKGGGGDGGCGVPGGGVVLEQVVVLILVVAVVELV